MLPPNTFPVNPSPSPSNGFYELVDSLGPGGRQQPVPGIHTSETLPTQPLPGLRPQFRTGVATGFQRDLDARIAVPAAEPEAWTEPSLDLPQYLGSTDWDQSQHLFAGAETLGATPQSRGVRSISGANIPATQKPGKTAGTANGQPGNKGDAGYNILRSIDEVIAPQKALAEWNTRVKELGKWGQVEEQPKALATLDQKMAEHQKAIAQLTAQGAKRDQSSLRAAIDGAFRFFSPA